MRISVSEAKGQLTELVKLAEAGEEVILTRHGQTVAHLVPSTAAATPEARRRLMNRVRASAAVKKSQGVAAAHSQDFLYDDDGLPG
ncbi:MAG TPA: type II toxin-antitoxin system prevent-host-death family antitoxin [Devosia sp.]|jgi:prevent-host-death family protein|nr:type II toxin-antitoxin system prevent-host-death family antitoxin [Devosia sp.]